MKLILPMAGNGQRFFDEGYLSIKPLIDIKGAPMFKRVVENIGLTEDIICVVRQDHVDEHRIDYFIKREYPQATIHILKNETEGAACTVMEAVKDLYDQPFLVANCDQMMKWDKTGYNEKSKQFPGGMIHTFIPNHQIPKHSYVKLNSDGKLLEVKEKEIISNIATVGVYRFGSVHKFLIAVEDMMDANDRTNNEFYLAPVYNYLKEPVGTWLVDEMIGMGTPDELKENWDKI